VRSHARGGDDDGGRGTCFGMATATRSSVLDPSKKNESHTRKTYERAYRGRCSPNDPTTTEKLPGSTRNTLVRATQTHGRCSTHRSPHTVRRQTAVCSECAAHRPTGPPLQRCRSLASGAADRLARERTAEQTHQPVRADRQHRRLRDDVHQLVVHLPAMRAPPHSTTPATHRRSLPGGTRRCDSALRALGSFFSSMRMKTSASVCEPISVGTKYSGSMSCRRESA
jgi:hypothetical protein